MKAFVTGGTGLLGSNLVRLLTSQGHEVKALARSKDKATALIGDTGAEIIVGDMENVAAFAPALAGSDVLFHTAAYFREYFGASNPWPALQRINIDGTIQLLTEAEKRGVSKIIYVSSSGVIGHPPAGQAADEFTPPDKFALEENLYFKSKVLAEKAIDGFLRTHSLPVVYILPTAMFGPSDAAPTSAGRIILDFLNRQLVGIPPGGFSVVDARDVAQAMLNAVEKGKSGERYLLNNAYYSFGDLLALLGTVTGIPAPTRRLPYVGALAFAYLSEMRSRLTGSEAQVTVNAIRTIYMQREMSAAKAKRELGVTFRPFEATLRDTVNWYVERNYMSVANLRQLAQV